MTSVYSTYDLAKVGSKDFSAKTTFQKIGDIYYLTKMENVSSTGIFLSLKPRNSSHP